MPGTVAPHERRLPVRRRQHAARQRPRRRRPAHASRRRGRRGLRPPLLGSSSRSCATSSAMPTISARCSGIAIAAPARPARPRRLALPDLVPVREPAASRARSTRSTTARRSARRRSSATATSSSSRARSRAPGSYDAVGGRVLIYIHKEHELDDVAERLPADHYVLVDDKVRILAAVKAAWGQPRDDGLAAAGPLRARRRRGRALPRARPHDRAHRRSRRAPPRRPRQPPPLSA